MKTYKLTCATVGCVAENVEVIIETDAENFMCGMCGNHHTQIEEVTNAGTDAKK